MRVVEREVVGRGGRVGSRAEQDPVLHQGDLLAAIRGCRRECRCWGAGRRRPLGGCTRPAPARARGEGRRTRKRSSCCVRDHLRRASGAIRGASRRSPRPLVRARARSAARGGAPGRRRFRLDGLALAAERQAERGRAPLPRVVAEEPGRSAARVRQRAAAGSGRSAARPRRARRAGAGLGSGAGSLGGAGSRSGLVGRGLRGDEAGRQEDGAREKDGEAVHDEIGSGARGRPWCAGEACWVQASPIEE